MENLGDIDKQGEKRKTASEATVFLTVTEATVSQALGDSHPATLFILVNTLSDFMA